MKMGSDGGYVSLGVDVLSLNYTVKHGNRVSSLGWTCFLLCWKHPSYCKGKV